MLKSLFKNRTVGFWVTLSTAALCLLIAVLYPVLNAAYEEYSVWSWIFPLVAAVGACVAIVFRQDWLAPFALLVGVLAGLGFFIYVNYYYVSVVLVGIDAESFSVQFILSATLFVLAAVAATVSVFMPQSKKGE